MGPPFFSRAIPTYGVLPYSMIYICVCVTLRNAIILRTAHGVAGPFVAQFSRATSRVLAEVKSWTTTARHVGRGLGILLHCAKVEYKTEAERPKSAESQDQRCVHLLANNCCSFSLEKQKSSLREF